jgi:divalent metal cation (Fe/Co/Zn/Cd) transporter
MSAHGSAGPASAAHDQEWLKLARRARQLSWLTLGWLGLEGAVAVLAGLLASSIALIGFGIDSAIEAVASIIIVWRFSGTRTLSATSEGRAQRLVAISFFLLAPYIAVEAIRALVNNEHPDTSYLGMALSVGSIVTMIPLGLVKRRLGEKLGSRATAGEGTQNLLCAYLAAAVLVGLLANTLFGAWWLDPVVALIIAAVAVQEGREAWEGEDDDD